MSAAMMRRQPQNQQEYYSKIVYEVSALVLNVMRPPPPSSFDFSEPAPAGRRDGPPFHEITPAGFASLLLGISLTLMLCGSVTFFLGFIMMPWVIGLVVVLYFVGVVSTVSMIGRAILCQKSAPPSPRKHIGCKQKREREPFKIYKSCLGIILPGSFYRRALRQPTKLYQRIQMHCHADFRRIL